MAEASAVPRCPQCGSTCLYRDGMRYLANGEAVQRWLCRSCGYRFSESKVSKSHSDITNTDAHQNGRLLVEVEKQIENWDAGATATSEVRSEVKGEILGFLWWMQKQGYSPETINSRSEILFRLARLGADLHNPESVKAIVALQSWAPGRKANVIRAYNLFAKWAGVKWTPPKTCVPEKLPFIPLEREIDDLIAGCSKHIAVALQIMKETGARSGEVFKLKWSDINFENMTITINDPEKSSHARIFKISSKLIGMLNRLDRSSENIFSRFKSVKNMRCSFARQRRRVAYKLGNPRLLKITFHTLRHWKATMEYAKTKDILHVMQTLGHKNIKNTLRYTQLINFEDEEYIVKVAKTKDEIVKLLEAGFQYECTDAEGLLYFKKRK